MKDASNIKYQRPDPVHSESATEVGLRRRGITEGLRLRVGGFPSSSCIDSKYERRLDMPRAWRGRVGAELPFAAAARAETLPSRLPGRKAKEDPLNAVRGCRGVSLPSRYPLDWLDRLDEGVDGVELEKGFGGVVDVLFLRLVGLRLRPKESLCSFD